MHKSSIRSPLAIVKGYGSAREGTGHFILQRVTAIALIPLTLWFIASLLCLVTRGNNAQLASWFASGLNTALLIAMLVALFVHAKIGMQVIIEDYVHAPAWKISLLLLNMFAMAGCALISVLAVLKLHLSL